MIRWTDRSALIATGSPFAPVSYNWRTIPIAQCNNIYIFPAVGLGVVAARARRVTDSVILAAARCLGISVTHINRSSEGSHRDGGWSGSTKGRCGSQDDGGKGSCAGEGDPVDSRLRSIEIITVPGSVFRFPDWGKWTLNFEPPISNGSEQGGMVWKIQKNLNPAGHLHGNAATRNVVVSHRTIALWSAVVLLSAGVEPQGVFEQGSNRWRNNRS